MLPPADPWTVAQIDAAVAPYVGRLPESEIAWMREQLAEVLRSDPTAESLLRAAHPGDERVVEQSGTVVRGGGAAKPARSRAGNA